MDSMAVRPALLVGGFGWAWSLRVQHVWEAVTFLVASSALHSFPGLTINTDKHLFLYYHHFLVKKKTQQQKSSCFLK